MDNLNDVLGIQDAAAQAVMKDAYCYDEFVTDNDDGSKTVRFEYPFDLTTTKGGETTVDPVDEVTLDRPKGGHLKILERVTDTNAVGPMGMLIHKMTRESLPNNWLEDRVDAADFQRLMMAVSDFFPQPKSPMTGESA